MIGANYQDLWGGTGEGNGTPLQYSCLEYSMYGGAWWAAVHGVAKSGTRLSEFTFTFHFHALEKEMATQSGVLAWRIPGTGEPGGLPSMGSQSRTRLKRLSSSSSSSSEVVSGFCAKSFPQQSEWQLPLQQSWMVAVILSAYILVFAGQLIEWPWIDPPAVANYLREMQG